MNKIVKQTVDDFFDIFFAPTISIEGGTGALKKIPMPDFPYLRRYSASVKDYLSSSEITFLDRRFRRIAAKRGFAFTGSFGDMSVYFDINAELKGTSLLGFTFGAFVTNSIVETDILSLSTAELSLISFVMEDTDEVKGGLEDSYKDITQWLYTLAMSENLYNYLSSSVEVIAEDPDVTYRHFIIGYADESDNIPITIIPGIEKAEGEKRE